MNDWQLLRSYAERDSESAFRELVDRHLNLVHSVALRQVNDPELAAEISQAVFILLARKSGKLKEGVVLTGWLFRTTRFVAARAARTEQRRRRREQEALQMHQLATPDPAWPRVAPALDEAMDNLGETDRNALLLRFFEGRNHKEVGAALGMNEEAARKRVDRALEKLRRFFSGRGLTLSAAALGSLLAASAVQAAPAGLSASIGTAAATSGAAVPAALPSLVREGLNAWRWTKLKWATSLAALGILSVALVLSVTTKTPGAPLVARSKSTIRRAASGQTAQPSSANRATRTPKPGESILHFHVVARDTGEPVANAQLALNAITAAGWNERFDLATDEMGSADVPYPADTGRIFVGVVSWGWAARSVTWWPSSGDPIPAEYTLQVDRVTNSVGGWVRDEKGQPIAGAEINAGLGFYGDLAGRETPREQFGFRGYVPVAHSDRNGYWTAAVIPPNDRVSFELRALHPEFAPTGITWWDPTQDPTTVPDFAEISKQVHLLWSRQLVTRMNRGTTVSGRVTDEAGNPIAGAQIVHAPLAAGDGSEITTTTDASGRFSVAKLGGIYFDFAVTAPGFAPQYRELMLSNEIAPMEIRLGPGALLRLRLVDEQGAPVPDATVGLENWGRRPSKLKWQAESDPDGRIEWNAAPADSELELYAVKDDWCYTRSVVLKADGTEHEIRMRRGLTVTGRVTDAKTGQPVEHVKACPGYGDGDFTWKRMDMHPSDGGTYVVRFEETRLPWRVRVEADGYAPFTSDPLPPDFSGGLDVVLRPTDASNSVHGVVLGPDGRPAAAAEVTLLTLDHNIKLEGFHLRSQANPRLVQLTGADGEFAFDADPRAHTVVAANSTGFARLRVRDFTRAVTIQLQPWGRIEGVIDPSARKRPIEAVILEDPTTMKYPGRVDLGFRRAKPDENGNFSFELVPAETFSLWLNSGMGIPFHHGTAVTVPAGGTASVTIEQTGLPVTGRFVASSATNVNWTNAVAFANAEPASRPPNPPPGMTDDAAAFWWVDFWSSETNRLRAVSQHSTRAIVSPDGSFEIEDPLPPGEYRFTAAFKLSYPSVQKTFSVPAPEDAQAASVDLGAIPVGSNRDAAGR